MVDGKLEFCFWVMKITATKLAQWHTVFVYQTSLEERRKSIGSPKVHTLHRAFRVLKTRKPELV
jgi:hypothetical protein